MLAMPCSVGDTPRAMRSCRVTTCGLHLAAGVQAAVPDSLAHDLALTILLPTTSIAPLFHGRF
jgi:hypothetical protein